MKTTRKSVVTIKTPQLKVGEGQRLAITGSCDALGNWSKALQLNTDQPVYATVTIECAGAFEYKFVLTDGASGAIIAWEEGWNRHSGDISSAREEVKIITSPANLPFARWKAAGVAIPVFSLRTERSFGIGEFADLKKMVDWAVLTGQKVIQLLPINDTTMTGTWQDSYPYNANSTFALHPHFICLTDAGVPEDDEYRALQQELNALPEVDYERVNGEKTRLLRKAFASTGKKVAATKEYKAFIAANAYWLYPYAAFRVLTELYAAADYTQWGSDAEYDEKIVDRLRKSHKADMEFHCFEQYHLYKQLADAKSYANSHGILLKGDLPIGISRTSADAWLNHRLFHMNSQAGAPPDAFSTLGQNWGFPTYDWERMSKDGYAWWKARFGKMAECFDAFRIDHILGFFRIWEIPMHAEHGLLGYFNPALPYSAEELKSAGFDVSGGRYVTPITDDYALHGYFGELTEYVKKNCLKDGRLRPFCSTQKQVSAKYAGEEQTLLREGLVNLLDDVLFIEDPRKKGYYHPRISAHSTNNYRWLEQWQKDAFNRLYDDFFFRRHNGFWKESAYKKLPELLSSTDMIACGEDLGMIPACVPETMAEMQILSLEIQRMPKSIEVEFADASHYPYMSVCATSTHDMNPVRAWWEEDRMLSQRFYNDVLGCQGAAPYFCEPWVCRRIVEQHLYSPSMLAILPLQDWLAMDGALRFEDPNKERINVPAISRHYWRYRMHLTVEQLLAEDSFNDEMRELIVNSGR